MIYCFQKCSFKALLSAQNEVSVVTHVARRSPLQSTHALDQEFTFAAAKLATGSITSPFHIAVT